MFAENGWLLRKVFWLKVWVLLHVPNIPFPCCHCHACHKSELPSIVFTRRALNCGASGGTVSGWNPAPRRPPLDPTSTCSRRRPESSLPRGLEHRLESGIGTCSLPPPSPSLRCTCKCLRCRSLVKRQWHWRRQAPPTNLPALNPPPWDPQPVVGLRRKRRQHPPRLIAAADGTAPSLALLMVLPASRALRP